MIPTVHDLDPSRQIYSRSILNMIGRVAHFAGWDPQKLHDRSINSVLPGLDLHYADPAQSLIAAGEGLDCLLSRS